MTAGHSRPNFAREKRLGPRVQKRLFRALFFKERLPKSAYFGFFENDSMIVNHIHLIFRIAIFNNREKGNCNVNYVINKITQIKKTEKNIVYINENARKKNEEKWADYRVL